MSDAPNKDQASISPQHLAEYEQICDMYRLGFKSILTITRMGMTWHAGLYFALGLVLSHAELYDLRYPVFGFNVRVILFLVSLLGILAGFGAIGMSIRYGEFHGALASRGIKLERLYGMHFLQDIEKARLQARIMGASTIALILFMILAGSWAIVMYTSFTR